MASLTQRGASAALWNSGGNLARTVLQFGIGILLARLIGPTDFGLVAIAITIIALGQLFVDFGFNAAIVQSKDLRQSDIDSLGTAQILVGFAMTSLAFICAGPIASFFDQPAAESIVRVTSLIFVIRAFGQNAVALLNRNLRFRSVQVGLLTGYVVGYVAVGLPLAFNGFGAWSVVIAQIVQVSLTSAVALTQVGGMHKLTLRGVRPEMLMFGWRVLSANLGSWTLANADGIIVGHVLGARTLGLYNRSVTLANAPTQAALSGLQAPLFAATARAQENPDGCRNAIYACIEAYLLIFGALLLSVAVAASTVVQVLYGPKWTAAAPLLTPLCLASLTSGVVGFFGPVLTGIGKIEKEVRAQWIAAIILVAAVAVAARWSAVIVGWSVVAVYIMRLALLYRALDNALGLSFARLCKSIAPGLIVGLAAAGGTAIADHLALAIPLSLHLLTIIACALAGAGVGAVICWPLIRAGVVGSLIMNRGILPPRIAKALRLRSEG